MHYDLLGTFNYAAAIFLVIFGLANITTALNLFRKVIGMVLLQSGVILFYVSVSVKKGASIPIIHHGHADYHAAVDVSHYANPLPHALMLTAIVVGVATLGVALMLLISLHRSFQTLEEDKLLEKVNTGINND